MAELITSAFARIGDKRKPPVTDASGAVNMDNGYTPNYEIDLTSGDPLARAVERDVQNYLFWLLTDNIMQYQSMGAPVWFSNMPGGYSIGAVVAVASGGGYKLYRSLTNSNTSNPVGSANWDEVWTTTQIRATIPMPLGGSSATSGGSLPANSVVTGLSDGTYLVLTDATAATISGLPVAKAGVLEVRSFGSSKMYRYAANDNNSYWTNTNTASPSLNWNRSVFDGEIGNTIGFIPRIDNIGLWMSNPSSSDAMVGIRDSRGSANVFTNVKAPTAGAAVAGVTATYGGKKFSMHIQAASTVTSGGDVVIEDDRTRVTFVNGASTTIETASLFIVRSATTTTQLQLQAPAGTVLGTFKSTAGAVTIGFGATDFLSFSTSGDMTLQNNRTFTTYNLRINNQLSIGDNDSGFKVYQDGAVYFWANNTTPGFFDYNKLQYYSIVSNTSLNAQNIELSHSTPFIDFHFNNSAADYTMRFIHDEVDKMSLRAPNGVRTQFDASLGNVMSSSMVGTWELPNSNQRAPAYRVKDMTVGSASYVPFLAGKITKTGEGYTTAVSFGCVTTQVNANKFQSPAISAYGDNGSYKSWVFNSGDGSITVTDDTTLLTFATQEWARSTFPGRDGVTVVGFVASDAQAPYFRHQISDVVIYIATRDWTNSNYIKQDWVNVAGLSANDIAQPYMKRTADNAICWLAAKDWVNNTFIDNIRQTGQAGLQIASKGVEYNVPPGCTLVGWNTEGQDPVNDTMIYRQFQKHIPYLGWLNIGY